MSGIELAKKNAATIQDLIQRNLGEIAKVVPKHVTPERLLKVLVACMTKVPALGQCTPDSLVACFKLSAELGLEPGGALGHLYLVPYGNVATPIIGYRGMIELARRSGQVASVRAVVVREKDVFRIVEGTEPRIVHEPFVDGDAGALRAVYCVVALKDGGSQFDWMTKAQVDAIRAKSKAGQAGPWKDHYDEMAKKTVTRRCLKYAPMSAEIAQVYEVENDYIDGELVTPAQAATAREIVEDTANATSTAKTAVAKARKMQIAGEAPAPTPPQNGTPSPEEQAEIRAAEAEQSTPPLI